MIMSIQTRENALRKGGKSLPARLTALFLRENYKMQQYSRNWYFKRKNTQKNTEKHGFLRFFHILCRIFEKLVL